MSAVRPTKKSPSFSRNSMLSPVKNAPIAVQEAPTTAQGGRFKLWGRPEPATSPCITPIARLNKPKPPGWRAFCTHLAICAKCMQPEKTRQSRSRQWKSGRFRPTADRHPEIHLATGRDGTFPCKGISTPETRSSRDLRNFALIINRNCCFYPVYPAVPIGSGRVSPPSPQSQENRPFWKHNPMSGWELQALFCFCVSEPPEYYV